MKDAESNSITYWGVSKMNEAQAMVTVFCVVYIAIQVTIIQFKIKFDRDKR